MMLRFVFIGVFVAEIIGSASGQPSPSTRASQEVILPATAADRFLPETVFFRGKQMSVESRNSEGILFPDGMYLLTALLDNSGHASDANQTHLACLLTEVPIEVNGHKLQPGVYGINLDDRHRFVMMDIAAHRVLTASSKHDSALLRPRPLQILSGPQTHDYRLYMERNYVSIIRADRQSK